MRFIDIFLLHCLLHDSPPDTPDEIAALGRNQQRVAAHGRKPGLMLERDKAEASLVEWGAQIIEECAPLAEAMDAAQGGRLYREALKQAAAGLQDPLSLPSARVLATMHKDFDDSFVRFTRAQSVQTRNTLLAAPWPAELQARFEAMAANSVAEQRRIEAADTMPFEIYRQAYLSPERLGI